ncbi:hypothetical protein M0811_00045 [Anaeramoeba ignava]|uniref:NADP-dependent oxidoreductase domain-containing protein n=1 Tax=Anaeramoeba ignava TaxID=1746090 RepID=A0A9Q0LPR5_ANAIG|nr:hypothetical protein M0811_00045 [Anaeramoeba ignava]
MQTVKLSSGKNIPVIGLGTWKLPTEKIDQIIRDSIEVGFRHFDCAWGYENEEQIGNVFKEIFSTDKSKREDFWITSKLHNIFHDPKDVQWACEQSIQNLGCDYLDLFLIHWPISFEKRDDLDPEPLDFNTFTISTVDIPLIQTWKAMEKLVEKGLVKSIGVSNFSIDHLKEILKEAQIKPVVNQVENHPYLQQEDLVQFCKENQIQVIAYSPLGSLDSKQKDDPSILDDPIIKEISQRLNCLPAQVVLKWQIQRGLIVIPKSSNPLHMKENLQALEFTLSQEDMDKIKSINRNYRFLNPMNFWGITVFEEIKKD